LRNSVGSLPQRARGGNMNSLKEFHSCNRDIEREATKATRREWGDEKKFNDRCEKWWSGGLLFALLDLLRRR